MRQTTLEKSVSRMRMQETECLLQSYGDILDVFVHLCTDQAVERTFFFEGRQVASVPFEDRDLRESLAVSEPSLPSMG